MLDDTLFHDLVGDAVLAPSSHNTQPWIFARDVQGLKLCADRMRALPVNDPMDRELTLSCGCALMTLRVAAAGRGVAAEFDALPEGPESDVMARIRLDGAVETDLMRLAPAIATRRTYRKRFRDLELQPEARNDMIAAAHAEGAQLICIDAAVTRGAVIELVMQGDETLWDDPRWRRELAQWLHPRRTRDGLSLPGLAVPLAQAIVRSFDMGGGVAATSADLASHSPLLALLVTPGDTPADWLTGGQALQRVLLTAADHGVQASYLNQPLEVPALRAALGETCGVDGVPQQLLRFGYPDEAVPEPTPRRPVSDVVDSA